MTEKTGNLYADPRYRKKWTDREAAKLFAERIKLVEASLANAKRKYQQTYSYGVIEGLEQAIDLISGRDPEARDDW